MRTFHVVAVTALAVLASCGVDGPDAPGASGNDGAAVVEIKVLEATEPMTRADGVPSADTGSAETGHDDAAHDDAAHDEEERHDVDGADQTEHDETGMDADEREEPVTTAGERDDPDAGAVPAADDVFVVEVTMDEFGYELDRQTVPVGEPVTFRFVNEGQIEHEAMFGSMHQQEEFAQTGDHGDHGSQGHHGEIAAITLDAAATGEMVMIFDEPGEVFIGCHLPGHWDAGMATSFEVMSA